ncbi:MAG: Dabb family protein [Brucellaceae bacterium]|jgi:hypothetical protein|nr:Dabb family protein [Brucellaceae bacterium]
MKKFPLFFITIYLISLNNSHASEMFDKLQDEQKSVSTEVFTSRCYKPGIIRHIILMRYSPEITEAQRQATIQRFMSLKETELRNGKPYIVDIEYGEQNSGEGADHNYEYAFIVTFKSEGDRNYYVGYPIVSDRKYTSYSVEKFKEFAKSFINESQFLVFDYKVQTTEITKCDDPETLSPQHNIN